MEIIAIVAGYLLGSIPSAYIAARLVRGKDIRHMGGGNVGALNTFKEVGKGVGVIVMLADMAKGVVAVTIAQWLLDVPPLFVLAAGLAAVVGHNWSVFLKFSGGKGMATTIGILAVLTPVYGYWQGLLIFFGVILVPLIITRNVALSMGISLLALPFIIWFGIHSGIGTIMAVILGLVIVIKFTPTARAALAKSKTKKEFIFDRWQREKKKEE